LSEVKFPVAFSMRRCQPAWSRLARLIQHKKEVVMGLILLVVLILLLLGVIPTWGHSRSWGYGPSGILGLILVIVIILLLLGYLPRGF
jgi:hypothetical protein